MCAQVWPLAIEFGRIVRDGKEDLQNLPVADHARVVGDPHGFRVACVAAGRQVVVRGRRRAAVIARNRADNAVDMLEHALDAPEASSRDHGDFWTFRPRRLVDRGRWNRRPSSAVEVEAAKPAKTARPANAIAGRAKRGNDKIIGFSFNPAVEPGEVGRTPLFE